MAFLSFEESSLSIAAILPKHLGSSLLKPAISSSLKKGMTESAFTDDETGLRSLTVSGLKSRNALKAASGTLRLEVSCCLQLQRMMIFFWQSPALLEYFQLVWQI